MRPVGRQTPEAVLFAHMVDRRDDDIDLAVAALLAGHWEYPDLDVAHYLSQIDAFAEAAGQMATAERGPHQLLRGLNRALFDRFGFRGNRDDYYDAKNSFLNEVIDRRLGIPITMSILYIEVGRRIGLDLAGLSFPGHFLVRYRCDDGLVVLDPFHLGMMLPAEELAARLRRVLGDKAELGDEHLTPATKRQVVQRLLSNLAGIYRRSGDTLRALEVAERQVILEPDSSRYRREVEQLRRRAESLN